MTLEFSAMHLIVGDGSPDISGLQAIFNEDEDTYEQNDTHYLIKKKIVNNNSFWFYARYGKTSPYSPTVYDIESKTEDQNPRNPTQIEPDKQMFVLYSADKKTLFLSNVQKKGLFASYLKSKIKEDVVIKAFFKNVDEFIEKIRTIEKVKFIAKNNLFSSNGEIMKIFPSPKDLYGLGMPENFSLEANFARAKKTDKFVSSLKQMVGWKDSAEAESLMCIGRDDSDFETIFNADSFIQKIEIPIKKNQQDMYDAESVLSILTSKLGISNEENT